MTDLTELRRLAEAATPGPWKVAGLFHDAVVDDADLRVADTYPPPVGVERDNAAYIAAADPQTVLALLDTLDRYRAALVGVRDLRPDPDDGTTAHTLISIARNALEAK